MSQFNRVTLQPLLAVMVKLRVELEVESKEKRAMDYALWDLVRLYHSCTGLQARHAMQQVLYTMYFMPGNYLENKHKKDVLAYALTPESQCDDVELLLLYRVTLNKANDSKLRRVNIPTVVQNMTQTKISNPQNKSGNFDLMWVLKSTAED